MEKKAILFLGLPGAGKTTQAIRISENFNFLHLTTSKIIRDKFHITPFGKDPTIDEERVRYDAGKIVNPAFVATWVAEAIEANFSHAEGIILDGSPRSREEAERLMPTLTRLFGPENIFATHLVVSSETARNRIAERFICVQCERTYSREVYLEAQVCAEVSCGGVLAQKPLDKPEIFEERLRVFQEQTQGAIDFFNSRSMLQSIDGELHPDYVYDTISRTLV